METNHEPNHTKGILELCNQLMEDSTRTSNYSNVPHPPMEDSTRTSNYSSVPPPPPMEDSTRTSNYSNVPPPPPPMEDSTRTSNYSNVPPPMKDSTRTSNYSRSTVRRLSWTSIAFSWRRINIQISQFLVFFSHYLLSVILLTRKDPDSFASLEPFLSCGSCLSCSHVL